MKDNDRVESSKSRLPSMMTSQCCFESGDRCPGRISVQKSFPNLAPETSINGRFLDKLMIAIYGTDDWNLGGKILDVLFFFFPAQLSKYSFSYFGRGVRDVQPPDVRPAAVICRTM